MHSLEGNLLLFRQLIDFEIHLLALFKNLHGRLFQFFVLIRHKGVLFPKSRLEVLYVKLLMVFGSLLLDNRYTKPVYLILMAL